MKKAFGQVKKYWKINLITFIISLIIGGGIFCLMFFLRGQNIVAAVDGAALASILVLFFGLLLFVHHLGAFDTFAFGFKQLGSMFFSKEPRKDGKYQDYRAEKIEKRNNSSYNFIAVIAAGLLMSIAIVVLEIIYKVSI